MQNHLRQCKGRKAVFIERREIYGILAHKSLNVYLQAIRGQNVCCRLLEDDLSAKAEILVNSHRGCIWNIMYRSDLPVLGTMHLQ